MKMFIMLDGPRVYNVVIAREESTGNFAHSLDVGPAIEGGYSSMKDAAMGALEKILEIEGVL